MSKMFFKVLAVLTLLVSLMVLPLPKTTAQQGEGDPAVLARMQQINDQLRAMGLNIAVEEIHFFTIGQGKPAIVSIRPAFAGWRTTHGGWRMEKT